MINESIFYVGYTVDPLDVLLGTLNEELDGKPNITLSNFTNWDEREERNNVFVAKPSNVEEVQNVVKVRHELYIFFFCMYAYLISRVHQSH